MTYQEFKEKYNGKFIDYDGQYGSQCWDLAQKYFTECLKLPASILGGCGLVSNMLYPPKRQQLDKYFDEINLNEAKAGDVAIWEYGHIAIFDHKEKYYFSQNPNPCKVMKITTGGVHIFRLKGSQPKPVEDYFVPNKSYKLLYAKYLRTSPKLGNNILPYKNLDTWSRLNTCQNKGGNAQLKKGVVIEPEKISKESNGRIWASYGNCWWCCQNIDGTRQAEKL